MDHAAFYLPARVPDHPLRVCDCVRFYVLYRLEEHILLRLAIDKPKLRWLLVVIAVLRSILVDDSGPYWKIGREVMRLRVWVFNNKPPPLPIRNREQLGAQQVQVMELVVKRDTVREFLLLRPAFHAVSLPSECQRHLRFKARAREECDHDILRVDLVKKARLLVVGFVDLREEIHDVIRFAKIVEDVVVLGRNAELFEFVFEKLDIKNDK